VAGAKIGFGSGVTEVTGTVDGYAKVALANTDAVASIGFVKMGSENDDGVGLGVDPQIYSPETDLDYRLRVGLDIMLEDETFCATAQNTGKFQYHNTTMTNTFTTTGIQSNSGNITTTTTGVSFRTYASYPCLGTTTTAVDIEMAFSAWNVANTIIDFGLGFNATTNPYAPTDGVYLRVNAGGIQGVVNSNGTESTTSPFTFTPTLNKKYQFIIYIHHRVAEFWINDGETTRLYGVIETPSGQGQPHASGALPLFTRHVITGGAASAICNSTLSNWNVRVGGSNFSRSMGEFGNAVHGSYQGLTGGTMGSLATYVNSTNPTAAAPANISLTANLPGGLGGQGAVTAAAASATDGIWSSYQVPAGGVNQPPRRLRINGIQISAVNLGAAVATTATTIQFSLAFGHTAVTLVGSDSATAKAPRRLPLGIMTWPVGAAIGQMPQTGDIYVPLSNPVYVNPSEFVALVGKFLVGTATASQVINFTYTLDYSWE
jgi:hypothetical protein